MGQRAKAATYENEANQALAAYKSAAPGSAAQAADLNNYNADIAAYNYHAGKENSGGSFFDNILPILGGIAGSFLLPGVGTALGIGGLVDAAGASTLLGSAGGAALGSAGGEALAGGTPMQDLTSGLEAGATAGVLGSTDIGGALGLNGSIGGTLSGNFDSTLSSLGSSLGITGATTVDPSLGTAANVDMQSPSPVGASLMSQLGLDGSIDSSGGGLLPWQQQIDPVTGQPISPTVGGAGANTAAVAPNTPNPLTNTPTFGQNIANGNIFSAMKQAGISPLQVLAGGGLAASSLLGNKKTGAQQNESAITGEQVGAANNLINQGNAGTLPTGQLQVLQNQLQDTITGIRSKFAQMGMSGSTSEQTEIAAAQNQMAASVASLAQSEVTTGLSALNQGSATNAALAQQQISEDTGLQQAIAALAGIPSGIGRPASQPATATS